MARELGLGITPWSPLKSGILSGKYTRQNAGQLKSDRGAWADAHLTDKSYALLDELQHVAKQLDTTVARVAIAWVQGRPGVTSTIIGARTLAQLEDNLKALDVKLASEHVAKLDELTKPTLGFPAEFAPLFPMVQNGGTTINGESAPIAPFVPSQPGDHY